MPVKADRKVESTKGRFNETQMMNSTLKISHDRHNLETMNHPFVKTPGEC